MQGTRAFESASEFRFYVGVVNTTDMCFLQLYLAGLDESAGISVISHIFGDFSAIGSNFSPFLENYLIWQITDLSHQFKIALFLS